MSLAFIKVRCGGAVDRNPARDASAYPIWYDFGADLAIAAISGIAATAFRRVKRRVLAW
jgi:hypothetical protein